MTRYATGPNGNQVAFEVEGSGPDIVLLHGITESRSSWDPLRAALEERGRVIAVDLRGHGQSEQTGSYGLGELAADVKAVCDEVGAERPTLVGHSLGGIVASAYAASYPTQAVLNVDQPLALGAFKEQLDAVEPMLKGEAFNDVMNQMFEPMMAPLPSEEQERLRSLRNPVQDVVLGIWEPVFENSLDGLEAMSRSLLDGVQCPYLALHGDDLGRAYRAWLADVLPAAQMQVWEGCAHYPHLLHPESFVERVEAYLP